MNKLTRIACLLWAFTAILSGCKKNDTMKSDSDVVVKGNSQLIAGDGKWDLLGHGYDITGELFERKNTSKVSIIDIDRFYIDYPARIPTPTDTKGGFRVYYGATAMDYVKDINVKKMIGIKGSGGNSDSSKLYGTGNFSLTNNGQSTYTYSAKSSYATYESWYRIKSIDFTDDVTIEMLKNYLTPEFTAYLSNYSAQEIVSTYGTHVLLGIDIGGRLKYDYKGSIVKETNYDLKLRAVKAGFSIGIKKIFSIDLSTDVSTEEKTTISNETTDKLFAGTFYGGNNSGVSFTGDASGNTSTSINLVTWQQSINVNNASLIGINNCVPIYDFITDPVKKQQVKDAVEKHIADSQIILTPQEVYEFHTSTYSRHAYNIDPNMYLKFITDGWRPNGQPFKAYSTPYNNAVPIYQHFNPQYNDRILWPDPNPGWGGYRQEGIIFYAYTTQVPGTVPIYSFIRSNGPDHYYSTNSNPFDSTWKNNGAAFYAFPN